MTVTPAETPASRRLRSESLSDSWLSARLGLGRRRIDAMRRAGELIGVREPGGSEWFYPAWQFSGGKPRPVVEAVVRAARERGLDEWRLYEVMTMRLGLGGDRCLADLLVAGEDEAVLAGIRASSPRP